jgi:uncharacterized protein
LNVDDRSVEARVKIALELLRSQSTMTLSTCDDGGWPQATPLFYYVDDVVGLHWFSSAHSAHSRHIARDPHVGVAVFVPTEHWRAIRGVQMRGEVSLVTGEARRTVRALFCERFELGATFRLAMMQSRLFRFTPSWIRYIDNARGVGYRFEITLPGQAAAATTPGAEELAAGVPDAGTRGEERA